MKAKKVEDYKDSNGVLHETEKSYNLAEVAIWTKNLKELSEDLMRNVENSPLHMFYFMKSIGEAALNMGKEEFEKEVAFRVELLKKNREYKFDSLSDNYSSMEEGGQEANPGYWLGITASDLGILH